LNNLKYIGGELRYGAPIKSLGMLEYVGGDFRPTTSELSNLGQLKYIGGTADFRGMVNLKNLHPLEYVGGNLNLVKSLKSEYNLSNIEVGGKVKYWNKEPKYYTFQSKVRDRIPPKWENKGPFEFENNLVRLSKIQQDFFNYYISNYNQGIYVDVGGMRNYIRYHIYSKLREYEKTKDFEDLSTTYETLRKEYPNLSHDTNNIEVSLGRELGLKKYNETVLPHEEYEIWVNNIKNIIERIAPKNQINSDDIGLLELLKIGFKRKNLTKFGKQNINEILTKLVQEIRDIESEIKKPFSDGFFDKGMYFKRINRQKKFNLSYYRPFFKDAKQYKESIIEYHRSLIGVPVEIK